MKGTVEKRGKNSFRIQISTGKLEDGSYGKIRETVKGTKKQAEARLAELLTEINRGEYVRTPNITVEQFLQDWLSHVKNHLQPNTHRFYNEMSQLYILPEIGRKKLVDVERPMVQKLLDKFPNLSRHIKTTISAAMGYAVTMNMIRTNPCQGVKVKKAKKLKKLDVFDKIQTQNFLEGAKEEFYYIYFLLALETGMRQNEILALRWHHINENYIVVEDAIKQYDKNGVIIGDTKTVTGHRKVLIEDNLVKELRKHKAKQNEHMLKYRNKYIDQNLVVANESGGVACRRHLRRVMKRICEKRNVPYIPPRNLRHTHATLLLAAGVNPKIVAERLGHSDVTLTLNTYSFALPDMQKDAVDRLRDFMEN